MTYNDGMHKTEQHSHDTEISKKVLRDIINAPWYVRNTDLHRDLNMEVVKAEIRRFR